MLLTVMRKPFLTYRRFRFNLYAVKAMKARLYLYLGNTTEAYKYAHDVITATTDYGEEILTLSGDEDLKEGYYAMPSESIMILSKSNLSNDLFSTTAYRLSKTNYEALFADNLSEDCRALLVWDRSAQNTAGTIIPVLRKYKQQTEGSSVSANGSQVVPLFRLAEMYLIAIETAASPAEANVLYKQFMKSRRIVVTEDLTEDELKEEIEKQYRREFYGEGQMFYYYKRHATPRMLWQVGTSNLSESNYVVPLPESELKQ